MVQELNIFGIDKTSRDYFNRRLASLRNERQSFIHHYRELAEFIQPRRGRFFIQDRNKGDKRFKNIINNKATRALQIARAGMMAGTFSPSRPWFSLQHPDAALMEFEPVKRYLTQVEKLIFRILDESNFYSQASNLLGETMLFGTGAMYHVNDFNDVARFYTQTAGAYMIDQNDRFEVDTLVREFEWTAIQIVEAFGLERVSRSVRTAYDTSNYSAWYPVVHFIEPNDEHRPDSALSRDFAYRSVYYEPDNSEGTLHNFLSVSGYNRLPAYVPRWDVTAEDIYGTNSPAMTALGDIKALQQQERQKAQGIAKMVNPPLKGPASLKQKPIENLPGGRTLYDGDDQRNPLTPIYQVDPRLQEMRIDIDAVERRIDSAFFVDMFLAITNIEGIQPRNQLDIIQRNEERLLQLGPVLERWHGEFLEQVIENVFEQALQADILPPAPVELRGQELQVRFISTLAQAQLAVATQNIERVVNFAGGMAELWPQALQKVNPDQAIDEYARAVGAPPTIIVPDEEVAEIRRAQQREAQLAQALEAANSAANTAGQLAGAQVGGGNALEALANG